MDQKYTVGAIIGALIWELVKQISGAVLKRFSEGAEAKRKLVREECGEITGLVIGIQELAERYFQSDPNSDKARELASEIRAKLKTCGIKFGTLNANLSILRWNPLPSGLLIRFRNAVSGELDVAGRQAWAHNDARFVAIHRSASQFCAALASKKFTST